MKTKDSEIDELWGEDSARLNDLVVHANINVPPSLSNRLRRIGNNPPVAVRYFNRPLVFGTLVAALLIVVLVKVPQQSDDSFSPEDLERIVDGLVIEDELPDVLITESLDIY